MQLRWIINTAAEVKGATEDMQATSVPSVIYSLFFFTVLWLCLRSLVSFIKEVLLSYYKLTSLILAFCLCRVLKNASLSRLDSSPPDIFTFHPEHQCGSASLLNWRPHVRRGNNWCSPSQCLDMDFICIFFKYSLHHRHSELTQT